MPPSLPNLSTQWFHLELVFGSAVDRIRRQDPTANIDWAKTEHYVRIGALAVACAMLEDAGLRRNNIHIEVLFEIRNAVIHNDGDISRNRNASALSLATGYLASKQYLLLSKELKEPFFSISGTHVALLPNLNYALRFCMR